MSLCHDFQQWTVLSLVLVTVSLTVHYAHGFVDGNNNGKDDVAEWQNSSAYRLQAPYIDSDKNDRHKQCDIFHGDWNNTDDGSCKYMRGNNTCILYTGLNLICPPFGTVK